MDPFDLRKWPGFAAAGGDLSLPALIDQVTIDSQRIDSFHALFVALKGQKSDGHQFVDQAAQLGALYALVHRSWQPQYQIEGLKLLRVTDPLKAFQEIASAYRQTLKAKILGVAGSYGKTMVKDLLTSFLSVDKQVAASPESFNSQIGVPLSLFTIKSWHELAIIEVGISEKNEMDRLVTICEPTYGILTPIGRKHQTTLGTKLEIAKEMMKFFLTPSLTGWALFPEEPLLHTLVNQMQAPYFSWAKALPSLPHAYFCSTEQTSERSYQIDFPNSPSYKSQITGGFYYFMDLVNMAIKAAWLLEVSAEAIGQTLTHYFPEPMRTEIWKSPAGPTFINDIYCSDPQSIRQALNYFKQMPSPGRKIFLFQGMRGDKQHIAKDYQRIGKSIDQAGIDWLLLVGPYPYNPLIQEIQLAKPELEITACVNYQEALACLQLNIKKEDIVLIKGPKKEKLDTLIKAFNDSLCNTFCFINFPAIQSNIATIRQRLPDQTRILVMVKALAYGTDEVRMANFLATCQIAILGVSYVDEAVILKRARVAQAIFVINAAPYEAFKVAKWDLEVGVSDINLIEALAREGLRQNKTIKVHLHINTGMSRFGCRPEEALSLAQLIVSFPSLLLEGIMTHFACADNPEEDTFTLQQAKTFDAIIETFTYHGITVPWKHAANSAAVARFNFPQYNMVRVGLAIYGFYSSEPVRQNLELRLALSLISRVVGINRCLPGETISYGRSYEVKEGQQQIAVLPIGYFDGLHRTYSGKGEVIIHGKRAPMVGKICMDFMMVDVTNIPKVGIGDPVLIFGEDEHGHYLSPEELASSGNSIIYELITCLGPRIQRIFVYEESHTLR